MSVVRCQTADHGYDHDYCQSDKVTDINEIMQLAVMMTPALVVDGTVKVVGKVPTPEEIRKLPA